MGFKDKNEGNTALFKLLHIMVLLQCAKGMMDSEVLCSVHFSVYTVAFHTSFFPESFSSFVHVKSPLNKVCANIIVHEHFR